MVILLPIKDTLEDSVHALVSKKKLEYTDAKAYMLNVHPQALAFQDQIHNREPLTIEGMLAKEIVYWDGTNAHFFTHSTQKKRSEVESQV